MSCTPGKVEVVGVQEVQGTEAFVLRFLQCRDDEWIGKVVRQVRPEGHLVRAPRPDVFTLLLGLVCISRGRGSFLFRF